MDPVKEEMTKPGMSIRRYLALDYRLLAILLSSLYLVRIPFLQWIGFVAIYASILAVILDMILARPAIQLDLLSLAFLAFCLVASLNLLLRFDPASLAAYFAQMGLMLFLVSYRLVLCDDRILSRTRRLGQAAFFLVLLLALVAKLIYGHELLEASPLTTMFIKLAFFLSPYFYLGLKPRRLLIRVLPVAVFFFFLGERTASFSSLIFLGFYYLIGRLQAANGSRRRLGLLFWTVNGVSLALPPLYAGLYQTTLGDGLQALSLFLTGKNFFSGRHIIWRNAILSIKDKPFLGHGFRAGGRNNVLLDAYGIKFSAHHLYIHLLLEGGLLTLALFIWFLYRVWRQIIDRPASELTQLSAAFLLTYLVFSTFELLVIGSNVVLTMAAWTLVGLGLMPEKDPPLKPVDAKESGILQPLLAFFKKR